MPVRVPALIGFLLFCLLWTVPACDPADMPLDAHSRRRVDSLTNVGTLRVQKEMDSLCLVQKTTVLPLLIDSIKRQRMKEIQENLRTIPKE